MIPCLSYISKMCWGECCPLCFIYFTCFIEFSLCGQRSVGVYLKCAISTKVQIKCNNCMYKKERFAHNAVNEIGV